MGCSMLGKKCMTTRISQALVLSLSWLYDVKLLASGHRPVIVCPVPWLTQPLGGEETSHHPFLTLKGHVCLSSSGTSYLTLPCPLSWDNVFQGIHELLSILPDSAFSWKSFQGSSVPFAANILHFTGHTSHCIESQHLHPNAVLPFLEEHLGWKAQFAERQISVHNGAVPEHKDYFLKVILPWDPEGWRRGFLCLPAACTRQRNVNPKSNGECCLARELLPGTCRSVQRGSSDTTHHASSPAGLALEDASLTQPKLSPSFGFSSVSYLCHGSLLGITHHPRAVTSSCPTAGEGCPLVCDEWSVTSGEWGVLGSNPHQCTQPSDGGALRDYIECLPWIQLVCYQNFHFARPEAILANPNAFPFRESFLVFGDYLLNSLLPESSQQRDFSCRLKAR